MSEQNVEPMSEEEISWLQLKLAIATNQSPDAVLRRLLATLFVRDQRIKELEQGCGCKKPQPFSLDGAPIAWCSYHNDLSAERDSLAAEARRLRTQVEAWSRPFLCPGCQRQIALFPPPHHGPANT